MVSTITFNLKRKLLRKLGTKLDKIDRQFRIPRIWSNQELRKFACLFTGDVINVSAWEDQDKQGSRYREYFINANSYSISNYSGSRGMNGVSGEIYLDLTQPLPPNLYRKYDVVFNHTTLEHIYDVKSAFENLCLLSHNIVILVVPFLQQSHSVADGYQDYWRFTPQALRKLFEENTFHVIYESATPYRQASVYLFTIATKTPDSWKGKITQNILPDTNVGMQAIQNYPLIDSLYLLLKQSWF